MTRSSSPPKCTAGWPRPQRRGPRAQGRRPAVDRVRDIAERRGIARAQVALAWLLGKPGVAAPIVRATRPQHLQDAIAALDVELTTDEVEALVADEPHPVRGFVWSLVDNFL